MTQNYSATQENLFALPPFEPGFYQHFKTETIYYAYGIARQTHYSEQNIRWLSASCANSEQPDMKAELGIAGDRLVFCTLNNDWHMPGDWIAYTSLYGQHWLRPFNMFVEKFENGKRRFEKIA